MKIFTLPIILVFSLLFSLGDAQDVWREKASLTADGGRAASVGFSIGHFGYIGLGGTTSGGVTDFWRWSQDSNTWTAIASYPGVGRIAATAFTIGGNGYVCLGYSGSAYGTDLWEYDTAHNSWTQKASFPGVGRSNAFVFVIGNTAYVGGGEPGGRPYYEDMWAYDAGTNTWTQLANFAGGLRAGCTSFTQNGYGYAGCGSDGTNLHNDLWQYNPNTNTWTNMTSLPVSGGDIDIPVTFVLDTLVYVGTGSAASGYIRDFWSYSATTNTWATIATLPGVGRWSGAGFSIGDAGYAGFGVDSVDNYLPDFWQYGPVSTGVNEITSNKMNVTVFPNPSNGIFTIQWSGSNNQPSGVSQGDPFALICIIDELGQVVYTENIQTTIGTHIGTNTDQLNLSNLASGIYTLRIENNNGIAEKKLVIMGTQR